MATAQQLTLSFITTPQKPLCDITDVSFLESMVSTWVNMHEFPPLVKLNFSGLSMPGL